MSFEVLPDQRYVPLVVIGSTTSLLSVVGSLCVLFMSSRKAKKFIMHRLMFGLSLADLVASTSSLLMPLMAPSTLSLVAGVGTHSSCSVSGFFLMTSILIGCAYNTGLSLYYMLCVCHNWKEGDFHGRPEKFCHLFAWVVPLTINIIAACTQSINPSPLLNNVCTYSTSPWTCNEDPSIDCTRSSEAVVTGIVIAGGIFLFVFTILGFVFTFLVWNSVRKTFKKSSIYRFQGGETTTATATTRPNNRTDEQILQVRNQALLYSLVYLNTFFWPFLAMIFSNQNVHTAQQIQQIKLQTGYYVFQLFYFTFYPLQGFLNFFIYTRLRVAKRRREDPNLSLLVIYKHLIFNNSQQRSSLMMKSAKRNTSISIYHNNNNNQVNSRYCDNNTQQIQMQKFPSPNPSAPTIAVAINDAATTTLTTNAACAHVEETAEKLGWSETALFQQKEETFICKRSEDEHDSK